MSKRALPSTLNIGSITVETHDLFLAREVASMIRDTPAGTTTEGVVSLDGRQIRWWRRQSNLLASSPAPTRSRTR